MAISAPTAEGTRAVGQLRGRVAVVVGASKGIGRAIALGYAREGAVVVAAARSADLLADLVSQVGSIGGRCIAIPADVGDPEQVQRLARIVEEEFGRVDVLVHSVGGGITALAVERPVLREELNASSGGVAFWDVPNDDFDTCLAIDLRSVFLCCKYFAPLMIQQRSGSIVVLGSYAGITGSREWKDVTHQAMKGGVHSFVAGIANELKPYNVAANVLLPGLTRTSSTLPYPILRERATQTPEDAVPAAVLLACQDGEGMTGRFVEAGASPRLPEPAMPIRDVLGGQGRAASKVLVPFGWPKLGRGPQIEAKGVRRWGSGQPGAAAIGASEAREAPPARGPGSVEAERGAAFRAALGKLLAAPQARQSFRALAHTSFRLFFLGQSISLPGTWMQRVATAWLAYQLTGSALVLGLVEFAAQIPMLLFAPVAGVAADRWSRKRILFLTQGLSMLLAAALAGLALSGAVEVWHLLILSLLNGVLGSFDQTARQALMFGMVEEQREDLASAIGLNSTAQTVARIVGPAAAGFLIAAFGAGICFLINTLSYAPILAALTAMKLREVPQKLASTRRRPGLRAGLTYIAAVSPIRDVLLLLALGSVFGVSALTILPLFAAEVFTGGPQALGLLLAASALGSLGGAIYLAGRTSAVGLHELLAVAVAIVGVGLIGFALAQALVLAMMFMTIAGFGMMALVAGSNTLLQNSVDEDNRGRVASWYTIAFSGTVPFGSLAVGAVASTMGAATAVLIAGAGCLVIAAGYGLRLGTWKILPRDVRATP